jgi:hypothetical protein
VTDDRVVVGDEGERLAGGEIGAEQGILSVR